MSIRSRIGWSFTALAVALLLALGAVSYESSRSTVTEQVVRHLSSVAAIQESRIESLIERNLERLALVSSRTQLRISLRDRREGGDDVDVGRMRRILTDALGSVRGFARLSVVDPDGGVILSVRSDPREEHPEISRALVRRAAEHPALGGFHLSSTHQLTLRVAGPLALDGRVLGALVADVHAVGIIDTVRDATGLGDTGETLLAFRDETGTPRSRPSTGAQGTARRRRWPRCGASRTSSRRPSTTAAARSSR